MNLLFSPDHLPARLHLDRPMTDDELMEFSAAVEPWPIEREPNGDVIFLSPAGTPGSNINGRIIVFLGQWTIEDGRGNFTGSDGGFHLPDGSVRAPDASWYSFRKLESVPAEKQVGYAHICPEFIIELRSKNDRLTMCREKMQMWLDNGAEVAWLIDPQTRTVTVFRPDETPEELHDPTSVQGTGPVRGFELIMSRVWG